MKYALALSMIPVAIAWVAAPKLAPVIFSAPEIAVKNITSEGVTARRMDEDTFRLRWSGVAAMPPAIEVHYVADNVVNAGTAAEPPAIAPSRHTVQTVQTVRRVALRSNVCSQHGMRRVTVGKRWRCRR